MPLRRFRSLLLVCLLTVSLLANLATASSYVWCVGSDGEHSALEFAPGGDCSGDQCTPASAEAVAAGLAEEPHGCGPCLDFSSAHRWDLSRSRPSSELAAPPAPFLPHAAAVSPPLPEPVLNTHRIVALPLRLPEAIRHLRTTVLLI